MEKTNIFMTIWQAISSFFVACGKAIGNFFVRKACQIGQYFKDNYLKLKTVMKHSSKKTMLSFIIMGAGQIAYKKYIKGIIYFLIQVLFIVYFVLKGGNDFIRLFTLGDILPNPSIGIEGDNSIVCLILGVLTLFIILFYIAIYVSNCRDAYNTQLRIEEGLGPRPFKEELKDLLNRKFYITVLFLPVIGVMIFNVLPIVVMIFIAFTDYGGEIANNNLLVSWIGLGNFGRLVALGDLSGTFFKILGWNILWAVMSTALNYFVSLALALLINKKIVKGKTFWRAFPIIAYAVPGFITLLGFKFMFSFGGPINQMITNAGNPAVDFLSIDAGWNARILGLFVNAWIAIPSGMLLATGILSNMRTDLYEVASIHGAKPFKQFASITLPYVVFSTTPVIINQFIGNFNNFGIFYFLRGSSLQVDGYFLASDTDLLINWLYNLSIDNNYYSIGAAISLIIFIITSVISLIVYVLSPAYRQEDTYK